MSGAPKTALVACLWAAASLMDGASTAAWCDPRPPAGGAVERQPAASDALGSRRADALAPFAIEAELAAELPWLRTLCAPLWGELSPDCMAELDRVYLDRDVGRNSFLGDPAGRPPYRRWAGPPPLRDRLVWRDVFEDPLALRAVVDRAAGDPRCQARRGEARHHQRAACAADAFARLSVLHGACGRTLFWGRIFDGDDQADAWPAFWERERRRLGPKEKGRRDSLAALQESELHFAWRLRKCRAVPPAALERIVAVQQTPIHFRSRRQELELSVAAGRLGSTWANSRLSAHDPSRFAEINAIAEHSLALAYLRRARAPVAVRDGCPQTSPESRHLHLPYLLAARSYDLSVGPRLDWRELPRHFSQAEIDCATPVAERLLREGWQPMEEQRDSDVTWPWAVAPPVVETRIVRRRVDLGETVRWMYENGDENWLDDEGAPIYWSSESGRAGVFSHSVFGDRHDPERPKLRSWTDEDGRSRWLDYDGVEHWIDADGAEHWVTFGGVEWILLPPEPLPPESLPDGHAAKPLPPVTLRRREAD